MNAIPGPPSDDPAHCTDPPAGSRAETRFADENGPWSGLRGAAPDVAELCGETSELKHTELCFRRISEHSLVGIYLVQGGRLTYANPALATAFALTPETMVGMNLLDLIHPEDHALVQKQMQGQLDGNLGRMQAVVRGLRPGGHLVPFEIMGARISLAGRPAIIGNMLDITERRKAEKMLQLRGAVLEAVADAIMVTNREGTVEWVNPAFCELSGYSPAEVVGKNSREVINSGRHDSAFFRDLWDTILSGQLWRGEIVNRRKDGSLRTEQMTITPLRDEQGTIQHFIAVKQDITDRKVMEAQFLQAQRLEAIGSLAGGIAHDLNNILSPILLVGGMLRDKLTDSGDREMLEMALSGAQRGANIIRQLLTFSRGQPGEHAAVQLRYLIKEVMLMMRETFPRSLHLRQSIPTELWAVNGDPTQLHRILLNLCVNARDAMPGGGTLMIRAVNLPLGEGAPELPAGRPAGSYVQLDVSDTGQGIPLEIQTRIYEPFFTTKALGQGTGLGLSTVLKIVQSHGGFIRLQSLPGRGTTFSVFLPAAPLDAPVPVPPAASLNLRAAAPKQLNAGPPPPSTGTRRRAPS